MFVAVRVVSPAGTRLRDEGWYDSISLRGSHCTLCTCDRPHMLQRYAGGALQWCVPLPEEMGDWHPVIATLSSGDVILQHGDDARTTHCYKYHSGALHHTQTLAAPGDLIDSINDTPVYMQDNGAGGYTVHAGGVILRPPSHHPAWSWHLSVCCDDAARIILLDAGEIGENSRLYIYSRQGE